MNRDKIRDLREEYAKHELLEDQINADPIKQFHNWFNVALKEGVNEPNAMTLATVDSHNKPKARIVLLKEYDENGFVFYTNYQSNKGLEILQNPFVALCFWWNELERQVRIEGEAFKVSREQSESYFKSRPRQSKLGAWTSSQSSVLSGREELESTFEQLSNEYESKEIPLPAFWGGYRIVPTSIEFWQGRTSRLHDRIRYERTEDNEWSVSRLSP